MPRYRAHILMERHTVGMRLSIMDFDTLVTGTENTDIDAGSGSPPMITYGFGTGDGPMSSWTSVADHDLSGDGVLDAVLLDFDGDGSADDAMWDSDGDGRADLAVLDTDDDGSPDATFSDTGRGLWDHRVTDVPVAGAHHEPGPAADTRPGPATDLDHDGDTDDRVVDVDGTGHAEIGLVFAGADDAAPVRVLVDLDGDGSFDAALIDDDSDGCADVWSTRGQVRFDEGSARD